MKHVGLGLISMSKLNKYVAYFRERQADIAKVTCKARVFVSRAIDFYNKVVLGRARLLINLRFDI